MSDLLFDAPGPRARRRMLIANIVAALVLLAIAAVFI
ncbi:amino acid ABC transporter permease, partial [Bacillus licheniformis]